MMIAGVMWDCEACVVGGLQKVNTDAELESLSYSVGFAGGQRHAGVQLDAQLALDVHQAHTHTATGLGQLGKPAPVPFSAVSWVELAELAGVGKGVQHQGRVRPGRKR